MKLYKYRAWIICVLCVSFLLCGCEKQESPSDYLGRYITRAKESDEELNHMIDSSIDSLNSKYNTQFPEEQKKAYRDFLQTALNLVEFELSGDEVSGDDFTKISITIQPVDIEHAVKAENRAYLDDLEPGGDVSEELAELLKMDTELVANAEKLSKKTFTIKVMKDGDSYFVDDEDIDKLLQEALPGYMDPYRDLAKKHDTEQ